MNKQVKILENKITFLDREIEELTTNSNARLEMLARNDPLYQNFQGQLVEKNKRIADYQEFLSMISSNVQEKKEKPSDEPVRPKASEQSKKKDKEKKE